MCDPRFPSAARSVALVRAFRGGGLDDGAAEPADPRGRYETLYPVRCFVRGEWAVAAVRAPRPPPARSACRAPPCSGPPSGAPSPAPGGAAGHGWCSRCRRRARRTRSARDLGAITSVVVVEADVAVWGWCRCPCSRAPAASPAPSALVHSVKRRCAVAADGPNDTDSNCCQVQSSWPQTRSQPALPDQRAGCRPLRDRPESVLSKAAF